MTLIPPGFSFVKQYATGKANKVVLASKGSALYVLKFFKSERKFKATTELNIYSLLANSNVNVPKVYDLIENNDEICLILEFLQGPSLRQLVEDNSITDNTVTKITELKVALSKITLPGYGYIDLANNALQGMSPSWKEFIIRSTCNDSAKKLATAGTVSTEFYNRCAEYIKKYEHEFDNEPGDNFNHGDFNPGNILFVNDKAFIIDIELAVIGSVLYDFAWMFNHLYETNEEQEYLLIYKRILQEFCNMDSFELSSTQLNVLQIAIGLRSLQYWVTRDTIRFKKIIENTERLLNEP
jgi:tRNA A-37 threonylcarbamoyl transferase component Bud32